MKAFHNDVAVKRKYLKRIRSHMKLDTLIRGKGWDGSKGCAVGCTLENYDHSRYPVELGIPEWLAHIEDTLFEGMSEEKSRAFPETFLKAIRIGSNLEKVKTKFIIKVLEKNLLILDKLKFYEDNFPDVKAAVEGSKVALKQTIHAHKGKGSLSAASAAWLAARSAAYDELADDLIKLIKSCK